MDNIENCIKKTPRLVTALLYKHICVSVVSTGETIVEGYIDEIFYTGYDKSVQILVADLDTAHLFEISLAQFAEFILTEKLTCKMTDNKDLEFTLND